MILHATEYSAFYKVWFVFFVWASQYLFSYFIAKVIFAFAYYWRFIESLYLLSMFICSIIIHCWFGSWVRCNKTKFGLCFLCGKVATKAMNCRWFSTLKSILIFWEVRPPSSRQLCLA